MNKIYLLLTVLFISSVGNASAPDTVKEVTIPKDCYGKQETAVLKEKDQWDRYFNFRLQINKKLYPDYNFSEIKEFSDKKLGGKIIVETESGNDRYITSAIKAGRFEAVQKSLIEGLKVKTYNAPVFFEGSFKEVAEFINTFKGKVDGPLYHNCSILGQQVGWTR